MNNKKVTFEEYFTQIYQERWETLKTKLLCQSDQIIRNCFGSPSIQSKKKIFNYSLYTEEFKGINFKKNESNLKQYYIMDPASVIAADSLNIQPDDFVLDMCAAPGGKTLILMEKLTDGILWANEISSARRERLKSVITEYTPREKRENIFIKGKDAIKYGLIYPNTFDKILLDAPCSGEQHLLHSPKELAKWTIKRTKRLSQTQYALLCSAILSLKEGGQVLYSTCSISPLENDEVIKKFLIKKGDTAILDLPEINLPNIEKTDYGYIMLPDKSGAGPIYFSRLKKVSSANE